MHVWLCKPMDYSPSGFPVLNTSQSVNKLMSIESVRPSNRLILCSPFSSYPQSFPASRSFPMSWLFASGGQSIGASALASVLLMNIQGWFSLGCQRNPKSWFDLLAVQRSLKSLPQHHNSIGVCYLFSILGTTENKTNTHVYTVF